MSTYGKNNRWKEGVRCQTYFFFVEGGNQQQHPYNNYINGRERQEKYERQPTTAKGEDRHHGVHVFLILQNPKKNLQDQNSRWD